MKLFRLISGLLLAILLCIMLPLGALAQDETTTTTTPPETTTTTTTTPVPEISVELKTDFPKIEINSGAQVSFQVTVIYHNNIDKAEKEFDLIAKVPENWTGYVNSSTGTKIASINLDPTLAYGTVVNVFGIPSSYAPPAPGEYVITLQVTSGDIISSIDLTAKVTAQYSMSLVPSGTTPVYSTTANAGKEKVYSVTLTNNGSAAIENVNLSYSAPSNWVVTFPISKFDSLAAGEKQVMDVKIKPADKAIAGDYMITLTASGKQSLSKSIDVRVTVATPSIWGIVGIIIIVIVIAGLAYVFMRFSRR
jgi:uncharacterized membrane protein